MEEEDNDYLLLKKSNYANYQNKRELLESYCKDSNVEKVKLIYELFKPYLGNLDLNYCFLTACRSNNFPIIEWLFHEKESHNILDEENWAFIEACSNKNLNLARWLYDNSSKINIGVHQELAFCNACESGSVELVDWFFSIRTTELKANRNIICHCLLGSILQNELKVVVRLLELVKDEIDFYYDFILNVLAKDICESSNIKMIEWLIELNFGFEEKVKLIFSSEFNENYSFFFICKHGTRDFIEWLWLKYGIDINVQKNKGFLLAWEYGNLSIAKFIFDHSKKPFLVYAKGFIGNRSMLEQAVYLNHTMMFDWLMSNLSELSIELNPEAAFAQACYMNNFPYIERLIKYQPSLEYFLADKSTISIFKRTLYGL